MHSTLTTFIEESLDAGASLSDVARALERALELVKCRMDDEGLV